MTPIVGCKQSLTAAFAIILYFLFLAGCDFDLRRNATDTIYIIEAGGIGHGAR